MKNGLFYNLFEWFLSLNFVDHAILWKCQKVRHAITKKDSCEEQKWLSFSGQFLPMPYFNFYELAYDMLMKILRFKEWKRGCYLDLAWFFYLLSCTEVWWMHKFTLLPSISDKTSITVWFLLLCMCLVVFIFPYCHHNPEGIEAIAE